MKKTHIGFILIITLLFFNLITVIADGIDENWHVSNNFVYNNTEYPLSQLIIEQQDNATYQFDTSGGLQGFCTTDKYIVSSFCHNNSTNEEEQLTDLRIIDKNTFELLGTIPDLHLSHAYDCTYNSITDKIIFSTRTSSNKVRITAFQIDKQENTFFVKNSEDINVSSLPAVSGIAFDKDHNQYIIYASNKMYITNSNFELIRSFNTPSNLIKQGMDYYNNHIYFALYEGGEESSYQTTYNSVERGSNLINVYDLNGGLKKSYICLKTFSLVELMISV